MRSNSLKILFFLLIGLSCSLPAMSEARYSLNSRQGAIEAGLGVGFTVNPVVRFDMEISGEYYWRNNISFGLDFDIFLRKGTIFTLVPFARYHFDIDRWPTIVPYVGAGVGGGASTNGAGVFDVMIPNFGFKWEAIPGRLFIGPDLEFHILTNFDNTDLDFHTLVKATYRF